MPKILSITDSTNASVGFVRPLREGEEVLNAGLVISVGVKPKEGSILHVQALVLRTSGITTQHPYLVEIWVDLKKEYGSRVLKEQSLECECPAGESEKCKHLIAVMLDLARKEENDLEDLSCTDIEQQWGALKSSTLADYAAKPLVELCHIQEVKDVNVGLIPEVTKEMERKWIDRLMISKPSDEYPIFFSTMRRGQGLVEDAGVSNRSDKKYSDAIIRQILTQQTEESEAVMKILVEKTNEKVQSLNFDLQQFYENNVKVSTEQSIAIASINQGTSAWLRERNKRITASTARKQYTYFANRTADWDKRYQETYHSTFKESEDTIRGLPCEGPARDAYDEKLVGAKVYELGLIVHERLPWLAASLDGVVVDDGGNVVRTIEIKTTKEGNYLTADELKQTNAVKTLDENGKLKEKNDHYGQVQIGMLLSGLPESDYIVYSEKGRDFFHVKVKFDAPFVIDLGLRLINVYFDIFLPRIMKDLSD